MSGVSDALTHFGINLVNDIQKGLLDKGVEANAGQDSKLGAQTRFYFSLENKVPFTIAAPDYWEAVDKGRGQNKKAPPTEPIARWLKKKGVRDPRKILLDIELRHKGISSKNRERRKLLKNKKVLKYDEAIKQLSWLIARSIGKKGTIKRLNYKGADVYAKTINDGRLEKLKKNLLDGGANDIKLIMKDI